MKTVTSVTLFPDAVGMRMSITYAEVDENSGRILKDNTRIDRILKPSAKSAATTIFNVAQAYVDAEE